jgi:hypothetical protein
MYIARQAKNINADIARNWSSWNFGQEGLSCTEEELQAAIEKCVENDSPLWISGFELWGNEITNSDIRELYSGYWVLVDDRFTGSIAGTELKAETLQQAIAEAKGADFWGDGVRINCEESTLVYSEEELHIFEV